MKSAIVGSSPRVRGSRPLTEDREPQEGIIPAGAGLTKFMQFLAKCFRDHPRGCGAHDVDGNKTSMSTGSSPRVRGSRIQMSKTANDIRIIPAGAGLTRLRHPDPKKTRDHPRGCGAHHSDNKDTDCDRGSSPRVRGSLLAAEQSRRVLGIIPAGAGLTPTACCSECRSRDHPRGCGAHLFIVSTVKLIEGSSPRVRGSRMVSMRHKAVCGIIPAGAGLTSRCRSLSRCRRDHPRGCGAHEHLPLQLSAGRGSSPRVRGSRADSSPVIRVPGIIPAGAGLTKKARSSYRRSRDHPRGCGAHMTDDGEEMKWSGSSPRVRGSPVRLAPGCPVPGIIPAGAGLTRITRRKRPSIGDHPRGCGAHKYGVPVARLIEGSSPRVRGSRLYAMAGSSRRGIIPAGAGLTARHHEGKSFYRDHPRGCGAHRIASISRMFGRGSSPRVRGSPPRHGAGRGVPGIIPAGAGLTGEEDGIGLTCLDHPRGCGAHLQKNSMHSILRGSSPRVRGSPSRVGCHSRP